jgi:signal transduction histidine kinase
MCRGVLLGPIDYVELVSQILPPGPKEIGLEIFASRDPRLDQWLNPTDHPPRALDPSFESYLTASIPLLLYANKWTIFVYTLPAFEKGSPRHLAYVTSAAAAGLTLLAASLVGVALRARGRQEVMTEQIREARDALTAAQRERERLSHDLHDNAIQSLYGVQLRLGHAAKQFDAEPPLARREITDLQAELDTVIAEIRSFILVKEGERESVDLGAVLRAMAERAKVGSPVTIKVNAGHEPSHRLSAARAVQLANIGREALSNSIRHGQAKRVQIDLKCENADVCLEIVDDGKGFDVNASRAAGIGLTSMAKRANQIGGELEVQSGPGKGTKIKVRVPEQ